MIDGAHSSKLPTAAGDLDEAATGKMPPPRRIGWGSFLPLYLLAAVVLVGLGLYLWLSH